MLRDKELSLTIHRREMVTERIKRRKLPWLCRFFRHDWSHVPGEVGSGVAVEQCERCRMIRETYGTLDFYATSPPHWPDDPAYPERRNVMLPPDAVPRD